MSRKGRIATPLPQLWRRLRYQYVPYLTFVASVALVLFLWKRQIGGPQAVGEVSPLRMDATSPADGTLLPLPGKPLEILDDVEAGQVLAQIDPSPLLTELSAMKVELAKLEAELPLTIESERMNQVDRDLQLQGQAMGIESERRRLATRIEELRLQEVQLQAEALVHKVTYEVQNAKVKRLEELSKEKLLDLRGSIEEFDARTARDEAEQAIAGNAKSVEEIQRLRMELHSQLAAIPSVGPAPKADLEALLQPHRAAIEAQQNHIKLLSKQLENLNVVAPVSGTVTTVWARPGQSVPLGSPIATIAANSSEYIVSYIRQEQALQPEPGMEVEVVPRRRPLTRYAARILRVGPQVELIPEHQRTLRDANRLEWGLPVWIDVPAAGKLRPGELVDLRFHARPQP